MNWSLKQLKRDALILGLSTVILICFGLSTSNAIIGTPFGTIAPRYGTIAAKGLVLGENGKPIWVEFDQDGKVVREIWMEIPGHYPGVQIDEFTVMPNHIHGIIIVTTPVGATPSGCPDYQEQADELPGQAGKSTGQADELPGQAGKSTGQARGPQQGQADELPGQAGKSTGQARGPAPTGRLSLLDVVHRFKSLTTARYRHGVMQNHWQPFYGKL